MHRKPLIILFSAIAICIHAQDTVVHQNPWHENILTVRWGGIRQYDEYLSPLKYKGQTLALQNEWWQHFRKAADWEHAGILKVQGAKTHNPTYSNLIYAFGVQGGWGAHYDFCSIINVKGLNLFLGPFLDFDLFAKELINNVNKPYSIDLGIDIKAHAGAEYRFSYKKTSYRLRYTLLTSIAGVQFVPEYGQSYYELTEGIIGGTVGFSSLHNKLTLKHDLTFDMQFPHSAWRLGVEHEYINNGMNGLRFQREQVSLVLGCIFLYKTGIKSF